MNYLQKKIPIGSIMVILALVLIMSYVSFNNYLLFHTGIELFSIIIAFNIFIISVNTPEISKNNFFVFIGLIYGFVGFFDLLHTISYKGMNIFTNHGPDLPTQLWIISRYIESISLLIAFRFLKRGFKRETTFYTYGFITLILLLSVFYWQFFPACFVEGVGLTTFKVVSEYIIIGILVLVLILLRYNKRELSDKVYKFMFLGIVATIFAELAFTLYIDVYGLFNLLGHLLKLISFYFIYKSINETSLRQPYKSLFYELNKTKKALERERNKLFDIAKVIFLTLDRDGEVVSINKEGCKILDYTKKEIVGKRWFDNFTKEEENIRNKSIFNRIMEGEEDYPNYYENTVVTKEGEERTIAWRGTSIFDLSSEVRLFGRSELLLGGVLF